MGAKIDTVREFYDGLAPSYDTMTGFTGRFERERPAFRALVERNRIRTAVDAGCGTGFHAMLLAELGVEVTALDVSPEMIRRAEENARVLGLKVRWDVADFQDLSCLAHGQYDAVFTMGNTLAHLLLENERLGALKNLSELLVPGGVLVIQILNYERILNARERIQQETKVGGRVIVRSYEYDRSEILFTIRSFSEVTPQQGDVVRTVRLHPLVREELRILLASLGFKRLEMYGSVSLSTFDPTLSKDLVILAFSS